MSTGTRTCPVCLHQACRRTNGVKCNRYHIARLKGELQEEREQVEFWHNQCKKWAAGETE